MRHQGVFSGLLGCVFGVLGIFTFGLIFVPLAAICSLVGLLRGLAGSSISGIGCSLLAAVLTAWGFVVSPSLWLLVGAGILASHHPVAEQSPGQSAGIETPRNTPVAMKPQPTGVASPNLPRSPELPAATASANPEIAPLPIDPIYGKGLADRTAWENWFNGLQGDFKAGAFYWAGQRSLPHPGSCSQMNTDFYHGCTAARERLATPDALRISEPDYKRGWNTYVTQGASSEGSSVTAAPAMSAASSANPQFDQYPANEIYRGPPVMPDFVKRDREFKNFRTRLQNGIKEGANFAGHYKIIQIGCGTECTFSYLADVSTGQIYGGPPLGGEHYPEVQLEYRISSKLIRTWWNPHPFDGNNCFQEDFALKNNQFISMGNSGLSTCPRDCDANGNCINSREALQDKNAETAVPLHSGSAEASVTAPVTLPSAPTNAEVPPKCFTVYPAVPPANCFAH
jgi:hypothetical protein